MKFITVKTYEELSHKAALLIAAQMTVKPDCVLGLATGSSPVGTYKELIKMNQAGDIDFSTITSVNLDEYVGLDGTNDQSYRYFMNDNLFNHVNIRKDHTFVPNGCAEDLKAEGEAYDAMIKELGGIDLQLLVSVLMVTSASTNQMNSSQVQHTKLFWMNPQSKQTHVSLKRKKMFQQQLSQWV